MWHKFYYCKGHQGALLVLFVVLAYEAAPSIAGPTISCGSAWPGGDMFSALDDQPRSSTHGGESKPVALTQEQSESLDIAVKTAESSLKVGLAIMHKARMHESSIVKEHLAVLSAKLRELDGRLSEARKCCNFQVLEGQWLESFDESLALLGDISVKTEIQSKLMKTLFATLKNSAAA